MKLNKQKQQVLFYAMELMPYETARHFQCPWCGKQDGGFSVTRTESGVLFNCFHASCESSASGFIAAKFDGNNADLIEQPQKEKKPKTYQWDKRDLGPLERQFFKDNFNISESVLEQNGVQFSDELNRVLFPVLTQEGYDIGLNARFYEELSDEFVDSANASKYSSKSILYIENREAPLLHWPKHRPETFDQQGDHIYVLVEDQVSAMRLGSYMDTCALLGTNLPEDSLKPFVGATAVVCLDGDAYSKSLKIKNKYGFFLKRCIVIDVGDTDIKDMNEDCFISLIEDINEQITR